MQQIISLVVGKIRLDSGAFKSLFDNLISVIFFINFQTIVVCRLNIMFEIVNH